MAISEAQFAIFMKSGEPKVVLAELTFAYESAGNVAEGTLYFGTQAYITSATDSPASQRYRDALRTTGAFARELDVATLGGKAAFSVGELVFDNADGSLDFLLDLVMDGRKLRLDIGAKQGTAGWTRSDFRTALVAVVERITAPDETTIKVMLRDKRLLLDAAVQGNPVGGSGPNATKYLPLLWGTFINIEPLVYDTTALIYSVVSNYDASTVVHDVRDSGLSLRSNAWVPSAANLTVDAGTDVFAHTAHTFLVNDVIYFQYLILSADIFAPFPGMAARPYWVKTVPDADHFTLSATKGGATLDITGTTFNDPGGGLMVVRQGWFDDTVNSGRIQLSRSPTGRLTLDATNNTSYFSTPFALARYLIETYGNITAADEDAAAFTAADVALAAKVSLAYFCLGVFDRTNLIQLLNLHLGRCFGWYGDDNLGRLTCGLVDPSGIAAATATRTLREGELNGPLGVENLAPTIGRVNVNYTVNHTVQADGLAATVTDSDRNKYSEPFADVQRSAAPSGTAYATNAPLYHKTMAEAAPVTIDMFSTRPYASAPTLPITNFAVEMVEDLRPNLKVLICQVAIDKYDWKVGEVVTLTHSRFGLSAGKKCRVVRTAVDLAGETVDLKLLTYIAPNVATASYP